MRKEGLCSVMRKRIIKAVFLAIVIVVSSLTPTLKAMEALGGDVCPAMEREFIDHGSEAFEEENFDVFESLLFEDKGELEENPYACALLWNICGIKECSIASKDTIGTNIIQWNKENSIELDVSTGTFKLVTVDFNDKKWQFILCNNTENLNDYGKPTMPYRKLMIPLNDAEVVDVRVEEECMEEFFKVDILPGFKPLPLGSSYLNELDAKSYLEKYFYADLSIYQSDKAFPSSTVTYETVVHGGNRILVLKVFPFKFYPTRFKIGVFDINIKIELKPTFRSLQFSSSLLQEEDPGYVIVTPSAFSSAVESLATWKEQIGFSVQITTLEYIYNNFPGRDKPEKLREFIKESYYTNGPEYYLLVGDCDVCPAREVWDPAMGPGLDNGTEPCDLYFECLDGDWDADGDSLFGEMEDDVDFFPEVKVGRLPVSTVQGAAMVCEMTRKIEEDPEPGNWIKKFLLLANTAFTYGDSAAALDEEINQKFLAGSFFDVIRLYDVDGSLSPSAVTSAMNQGVGLVDFFDHGAYYTWVGALQTSDVLNLLNGNKTFLAFAMACETAAFDYQQYTTISEAFFKNPNGGAIAYIGATRVAWAGYDCFDGLHHRFWVNFLTEAIANMEARPKDALQAALIEMASTYAMSGPSRETVYQTIYFGDPALNLYWKHDITATATPDLETNQTGTINGICQLLHSGIPITGQYEAVVRDPAGNLIAQQSGILGVQGNYTMSFSAGTIPGNYTIETSVVNPFNYTHISRFTVGTLNVTLGLSSVPVYETLLEVSGQVLEDGIPVPGQANVSIVNDGVIVESKVVAVNASGQYEIEINITTFGRQELHVWASNLADTKHGGTSTAFKVKRGDILILVDDSGDIGLQYPGGWYDLNRGSSTSYYYFYAALEDEYYLSVYRILYDPVPDLNLLQQYSAVVVTCGDHYGACFTSVFRHLTGVLTQYHNSGGNLLFEGGDLAYSLSSQGYMTFMQSVLHANLTSDVFNMGLYLDNSVPHPVTQGLPSMVSLEGGLGSPSVDVVSPANESEMVSGYVGYAGCSIIAFSGEAGLGSMVYFAFSIDGIADVGQRELLIRNSIGYIIFPTLTAWLSDYALRVNTTETIWVRVKDANTGQLIENATVMFMGCGVLGQNTTDDLGECSIFIAPTSSGIINVIIQKVGYLDFTAQIVVYNLPKFKVDITPDPLKKKTQTVEISVTDFYEGNPVADVNVTLLGCGLTETGYTNLAGSIQFVVTPTSYGHIQLNASRAEYEDYTTLIGVYIKAVVVDSFGTDMPEYSWWDDLEYLWENYGTIPIQVDIGSLDKYGITYEDLVESEADVLVIPCAASTSREYTDSEISAITKYTLEGHGLIATSGTLYEYIPNNNKLAPLFGMREDIVYTATWFSSLNILEPAHPLFINIPSPYFVGDGATVCPQDYSWDSEDVSEGIYIALSDFRESAIVVHRGVVFIGHWVGCYSNTYDLQLMYNAITWSKYEVPEHDLKATLEAPDYMIPNETTILNATVSNIGLNNETDVDLILLINSIPVNSTRVPELLTGSSYTINYLWTPTDEAIHNITAYALPVPDENFTLNNAKSKYVSVTYPLINPLEGQYANYTMYYYDSSEHIAGMAYWNFTYDYYVEPCKIYITFWLKDPSGYTSTGWMIVNTMNRLVESGVWADLWYPGWIETNINIGSTIDLLSGNATVNDSRMIFVDARAIDCWELSYSEYGYLYTFWYDKTSGLWIGMETVDPYSGNRMELLLVDTNVSIGTHYAHDLGASLETPRHIEPSETALLNATVYNLGLSNETDIHIQLSVNGTIEADITLPQLNNGTWHTINYFWTPTTEGIYNITAYVLPVAGENITANNVAVKMVNVRPVEGYVLFDQTHWTDSIVDYSIWLANLIEGGYVVDTLTISPITPSMLKGYDVFVIPQARDYYSSDELSVIQDFVFNGGGLLVIGDDEPDVYTNLTSFAGITWTYGGLSGITYDVTSHEVTEGVTSIYLDAPIAEMLVATPAIDLIRDSTGGIMLAAFEHVGRVIGFADEGSLWNYGITEEDNLQLANNMIDWLLCVKYEHELVVYLDAPNSLWPGDSSLLSAALCNRGLNNETDVELFLLINGAVVENVTILRLVSGACYRINHLWIPTIEGVYNVTTYAPPVCGENVTVNNVASRMVCVCSLPTDKPAVYVSPHAVTTAIGKTFTVAVNILNVTEPLGDLYGFDIQFTWDPTIIEYVNHTITVPIEEYPEGVLHEPILTIMEIVESGRLWFAYASLRPAEPFNNPNKSNSIFFITFRVVGEGTSELSFAQVDLADVDANPILHTSIDGLVVSMPPRIRDVAIIDVSSYANVVYIGRTVNITVLVANQGISTETFNVTLYANTTIIGVQTIALRQIENATLKFNWNTTGLAPGSNFTIWAEASQVPFETNILNNFCYDGWVKITMVGDLNGDDIINIYDIVLAATAYDSRPGDPNWNPEADIAKPYEHVDIFDMVTIASKYGQTL